MRLFCTRISACLIVAQWLVLAAFTATCLEAQPQQNSSIGEIAAQPANVGQAPFELTPIQQERLDELLTYWERRSSSVKTYDCEFKRYNYDSVFGPQNPRWHKTQSEGIIRFGAPDKGEFHVTSIGHFQPPAEEGAEPTYPMQKTDEAEHWICDGTSIYELNASEKELIQRILPPELQGNQISDGPLPFMFGATKAKIQQKYWIRELMPPPNRKGEYWFEAYPKLAENAAQFQKVMVILDEKTFLPNALQIFPPGYDGRKNFSREVYTFSNRQIDSALHRTKKFFGSFISPKTPSGWKKIVENFAAESPAVPIENGQTARQPVGSGIPATR